MMKPTKYFVIAMMSLILHACTTQKQESGTEDDTKVSYKLEQRWATDTLLRTPESVLFDATRNVIYVSNVNMNPWEKDGNGFISKVSPTGEILELEWVTGMNGPKGMALVGDALYVADLDELVEIDVTTGSVTKKTVVEGASGMNDISSDAQGNLYISDSNGDKIFKYADGSATIFMADLPSRPNGQLVVGEHLMVAFSGAATFSDLDFMNNALTTVADSIGHGDGITPTNVPGTYLVSDWEGEIFIIGEQVGKQSLLNTKAEKKNTADIWFIAAQDLVLVPTFFDNRVVAYQLIEE